MCIALFTQYEPVLGGISMKNFVLKGNICHSDKDGKIETFPNSYLVCENGLCAGIFSSLPEEYRDLPLTDWGDRILIRDCLSFIEQTHLQNRAALFGGGFEMAAIKVTDDFHQTLIFRLVFGILDFQFINPFFQLTGCHTCTLHDVFWVCNCG